MCNVHLIRNNGKKSFYFNEILVFCLFTSKWKWPNKIRNFQQLLGGWAKLGESDIIFKGEKNPCFRHIKTFWMIHFMKPWRYLIRKKTIWSNFEFQISFFESCSHGYDLLRPNKDWTTKKPLFVLNVAPVWQPSGSTK